MAGKTAWGLRIRPVTWLPADMAIVTDQSGKLLAVWAGSRFHVLTDLDRETIQENADAVVNRLLHGKAA